MTNEPSDIWMELNHRYLLTSLDVIRYYLERCVEQPGRLEEPVEKPADKRAELQRIREQLARPAALDVLCSVFGLTGFERDLLLLCACCELDQGISDLCVAIQGSPTPTFGLALRVLPDAAWGALAPDTPLRRWHLLELGAGPAFASRGLHLDESILHFLLGLSTMDERLYGLVEPVERRSGLSESQRATLEPVSSLWLDETLDPILCICTTTAQTARTAASEVCARHGLRTYALQAVDLPDSTTDQIKAARLWERHAAIEGCGLLIETNGEQSRDKAAAWCDRLRGPLIVASEDVIKAHRRPVVRVDMNRPHSHEQRDLWRRTLGEHADSMAEAIARAVSFFSLDSAAIESVATEVLTHTLGTAASHSPQDIGGAADHLWRACRLQARPRLDELAQRIDSRATWEDLIVSDRQKRQLQEVALHIQHRTTVYDDWGYSARTSRGLGISALFAGPSGTGKGCGSFGTMQADYGTNRNIGRAEGRGVVEGRVDGGVVA